MQVENFLDEIGLAGAGHAHPVGIHDDGPVHQLAVAQFEAADGAIDFRRLAGIHGGNQCNQDVNCPQVENACLHVLRPNGEFDAPAAMAQDLRQVTCPRIDIHLQAECTGQVAFGFDAAGEHAIVELPHVDVQIDFDILVRGLVAQP